MALFVESWCRQSRWMLGAAALMAFAAIRSYEPTAVLLAGAPLALLMLPRAGRRRTWTWLAVFGGGLAVGGLLALVPPPDAGPGQLYQAAADLDPHPFRVAPRLAHLLALLVVPAFGPPASSLTLAASLAPILTLLVGAPLAISDPTLGRGDARRCGCVLLIGVAWTLLGLLPFALSAVFATGERTQFLSAPGFGLAFAALLFLAGTRLGRRPAAGLALAVTVWLVLVVAVRTVAMQERWDERSTWSRQRSLLAQLVSAAADVRRDTLLILVDQSRAFESTFAFRHAVRYLYDGKAAGWVVGAQDLDLFYPTRPAADGIHADVWPLHQRSWRESPRVYSYDEVIVVWVDAAGALHLLRTWPEGALPPLPAGARYQPAERVLGGVPSLRARRALADVR
jgi:hypothetical protein